METTTKLPADFKQKWIAALRSGEYKQGINFLCNHQNGSMCCMGVAYKVATGKRPPMCGYMREYDSDKYDLIPSVLLHSHIDDLASVLAAMNDVDHKSFDEIADWIEENL